MNTKNVDNVAIEIDDTEERNKHNSLICRYLYDKNEYNSYFQKVCKELGLKELSIIDKISRSQSIKNLLMKYLVGKKKRKDSINDYYPLQRLLTHDSRRSLLMWTIKSIGHSNEG